MPYPRSGEVSTRFEPMTSNCKEKLCHCTEAHSRDYFLRLGFHHPADYLIVFFLKNFLWPCSTY